MFVLCLFEELATNISISLRVSTLLIKNIEHLVKVKWLVGLGSGELRFDELRKAGVV